MNRFLVLKGGSGRNEIALSNLQRTYPDMTMEEMLAVRQDAYTNIRLAMVRKGHPQFAEMDDEALRDFINEAMEG